MCNRDFIIDIDYSAGYEEIEKSISSFPLSVDVRVSDSGDKYIHQNKVSTVAGILLEETDGFIQSYSTSSLLSETKTDELLLKFSEFFKQAKIPHKIIEILHDLDFDEEIISYKWEHA
ncbi:hypothetical protein BS333_17090 [Vibrio azureus]|uniref:Uncharacterized protein n=1 Tax=Vibrio azureus NBRC 104587 TaxID=1219077 RepID=U3AV88_9VIBR|nr:hypothetical protein [Vibrio azureus]AUI88086.1 hypothetical protein BS333_17090 [Vibrio azureus]GAD77660.1 hypothetical protein VAZ01S_085_00060 [Vibrio azureus NBRC 104587]